MLLHECNATSYGTDGRRRISTVSSRGIVIIAVAVKPRVDATHILDLWRGLPAYIVALVLARGHAQT